MCALVGDANCSTGINNFAAGCLAMRCNTTGSNNTAIGFQALVNNTSGSSNTASGKYALRANTTGSLNIALGSRSLISNTTGCQNTASGYYALKCNTTGCDNTASGRYALAGNTIGCDNTGSGYRVLFTNSAGSHNIGFGCCAGYNSTGNSNIFIGAQVGLSNVSGNDDIVLGHFSDITGNVCGASAFGYCVVNGTASSTMIGYGATANLLICCSGASTGAFKFNGQADGTLSLVSGVLTSTSDERLKDIEGGYSGGLAEINAINPILYKWKLGTPQYDGKTVFAGFSAQNVGAVIPEAITLGADGFYGFNDRPVLAAAVNAIKELDERTASSSAAISDLTASTTMQFAALSLRLGQIEGVGSSTASVSASNGGNALLAALQSIGATIENSVVHFYTLVVDELTVKHATVEQIDADKLCLKDKSATLHCFVLDDGSSGVFKLVPADSATPTPTPTPTSTPPSITILSPSPTPSPESLDTPSPTPTPPEPTPIPDTVAPTPPPAPTPDTSTPPPPAPDAPPAPDTGSTP